MDQNELIRIVQAKRESKKEMYFPTDVTGTEIYLPTEKGPIRALHYTAGPDTAPVYFDIHGGGFIMGSPEYDDGFCQNLCHQAGVHVFSIDYPLAPEHPFPQDKETVYAAIRYVAEHAEQYHIDRDRMIIGGQSAGGNIATVIARMAKESGDFSFVCQILDYPPLDLFKPDEDKLLVDGVLSPQSSQLFKECYCSDPEGRKNPYCSPCHAEIADLMGLPDALVITCEHDPLRDEGEQYMKMLMAAGVDVQGKRFYDAAHGFTMQKDEKALEGQQYIIDFVKRKLEV